MKTITLLLSLFAITLGNTQSLPIDFESSIVTADFTDFDGGTATVMTNPQSGGINTSATVAQIVRNGGQIWAGSKLVLSSNLDFTTDNTFSMKVFTTAPVGTIVKIKLEGNGAVERDQPTTVSGAWEELSWDFTGTPTDFNTIAFMFDYGNVGDGSTTSTFLFDDMKQVFGGTHIDLPVDFEGSTVNYTMSDFGGNVSSLTTDPTDPGNMVMEVEKTDSAATWAGTTIGTPAGFATDIPLTLTSSKMTVRVWSPDAGTPIRLKVEDSDDNTHTCETETNTTVAGGWEVLEFDFLNQAPGTELLSVGLSKGWTYNMASIFFNFDTDGATAGSKTYYFDDVKFGDITQGNPSLEFIGLNVYPNPASDSWTIGTDNQQIDMVELYDAKGDMISVVRPANGLVQIANQHLSNGLYFAKVYVASGDRTIKLIKK